MTSLGVFRGEGTLRDALALGGAALLHCQAERLPTLVSAAFSAEALVLGKLQREATLRERSPARFDTALFHRHTTGSEAQLSGAVLYHALALPRVDALYPDASARTLLNRNLRAILRGYTAAGVPLRYFGTEVLALLGQPVALVGYEQTASGAVLIEVLIGLEQPCVVRPALQREPPSALYEILRREPPPEELLERAVNGVIERLGASAVAIAQLAVVGLPEVSLLPHSPAQVTIPLGVVEAVVEPRVRITGDLLVGSAALAEVERRAAADPLSDSVLEPLRGAPLDGARPQDVLQVLEAAFSARSIAPRTP